MFFTYCLNDDLEEKMGDVCITQIECTLGTIVLRIILKLRA